MKRTIVLPAIVIAASVFVGVTLPIGAPASGSSAAAVGIESVPFVGTSDRAQDTRLDMADANIEKAIALLKAAENPSAKSQSRPFGGHRTKAIASLERARREIAAAKAFATQSIAK